MSVLFLFPSQKQRRRLIHEAIFIDLGYFLSFITRVFNFPQSTAFQMWLQWGKITD
jgi:hypothetical protein